MNYLKMLEYIYSIFFFTFCASRSCLFLSPFLESPLFLCTFMWVWMYSRGCRSPPTCDPNAPGSSWQRHARQIFQHLRHFYQTRQGRIRNLTFYLFNRPSEKLCIYVKVFFVCLWMNGAIHLSWRLFCPFDTTAWFNSLQWQFGFNQSFIIFMTNHSTPSLENIPHYWLQLKDRFINPWTRS